MNIAIESSDEAVNNAIHAGLRAFNRVRAHWPDRQHFNAVLRDDQLQVCGGLLASVNFDVLLIEDLFIAEAHRRGGHGTGLMALAEEEGFRRGARLACVSTFSWQARPFYERLGYSVFGELSYQGGAHTLYWLKKRLCA